MLPLLFLSALSFAPALSVARVFQVHNNCPSQIDVYVSGIKWGSLTSGQTQPILQGNNWSGFIYTDANGGNQNGVTTTRAGFYGELSYYYVVIDPNGFNTGVSITPDLAPQPGGWCIPATCDAAGCSTAFTSPPTRITPDPTGAAPRPPMYGCPTGNNDVGFKVTFCPTGSFPSTTGPPPGSSVQIHPNGNANKCLDVRGAVYANGTPVQIYDCNGTGAQKWLINRGNTKVKVAGTNFCLDAGSSPASGVGMKIWTCYDNLPAQAWYFTNDGRIPLASSGQCLDLPNGVLTNGNQVQTWQCTAKNLNQVWTI